MKILHTQETTQVVKFAGGQVWSWSSLNDITRGHGQGFTVVKFGPGQVLPCHGQV